MSPRRRLPLVYDATVDPIPARKPRKEEPFTIAADRTLLPPFPLDPIWGPKMRDYLAHRDGWTCCWCTVALGALGGALEQGGVLAATIEHLIPKHAGGTDDPSNLALACYVCNSSRERGAEGRPRYLGINGAPTPRAARRAARLGQHEPPTPPPSFNPDHPLARLRLPEK